MCCAGNMCLVAQFLKTFYFTVSSKCNSCSIWCLVFVRWSRFFFYDSMRWIPLNWWWLIACSWQRSSAYWNAWKKRSAGPKVSSNMVCFISRNERRITSLLSRRTITANTRLNMHPCSVRNMYLLKHNVASGRNEHMPAWFFRILHEISTVWYLLIQSGPKKCIHSLLINIFGINLNEISISGWECNIMFSQQMAQALLQFLLNRWHRCSWLALMSLSVYTLKDISACAQAQAQAQALLAGADVLKCIHT